MRTPARMVTMYEAVDGSLHVTQHDAEFQSFLLQAPAELCMDFQNRPVTEVECIQEYDGKVRGRYRLADGVELIDWLMKNRTFLVRVLSEN